MTDDATLGIDVGTTNAKAAVLDLQGKVLAEASCGYPITHPGPGAAEQEAEAWWEASCKAARTAVQQAARQHARVRAIAASGQGCALTPVDRTGRALRRALIWMDTRSEPQCEWMRRHAGEKILAANSNLVAPYNVEPKALWLRDNQPDIFAAAHAFLTSTAYVIHRLCGAFVTNRSDGGILFSYDLANGDWSDDVLDAIGLPRHKLPRLAACDEVVGVVLPEVAEAIGVARDTPVIAGGEDTSAAALAAGVVCPGQAYLSLGTAGVVGICLDRPLPQPRLLSFPHVLEGMVLLSGSMSSLGAAMGWVRDLLEVSDSGDPYSALSEQAVSSPPGAGGLVFLPYLTGELHPILDPFARGTFIGLSLTTGRPDLVRAIMEGGAYAIRHNLETAAQVGASPAELRAVGGPSRSAVWCQTIADITGLPVLVMEETAGGAPAGDALLAAAGAGLVSDLASAAEERARRGTAYIPRSSLRDRYDALYGVYLRAYERLKDEFRILAKLPGERA